MAIQDVHNDRQLVRAFAAIETTPGTAAVADFVLLGDMVINETRPLSDVASFAGTYAQDYAVVYGPKDIGGTYSEPLTYEGLANTARLALAAGPTGVSDAQTTPCVPLHLQPQHDGIDAADGIDLLRLPRAAVPLHRRPVLGVQCLLRY